MGLILNTTHTYHIYQKEIKNLMLDEIIKRYQYKEGLYQYYVKNNLEIKKAISILNNTAEYNKILKI